MRPSDAKAVDIADVYKSDQLAGYLTRTREGTSFEYAHDYIGGTSEAVASTLPLREAPYATGAGVVPAFVVKTNLKHDHGTKRQLQGLGPVVLMFPTIGKRDKLRQIAGTVKPDM
jgi:HipA-like protein